MLAVAVSGLVPAWLRWLRRGEAAAAADGMKSEPATLGPGLRGWEGMR